MKQNLCCFDVFITFSRLFFVLPCTFIPDSAAIFNAFFFAFSGMFICKWLGMFTPKSLPLSQMLPISVTFCGFVVFTNLSLQCDTVGTYQIIKCLTSPCIMAIQTYFYARTFSTRVKLTLVNFSISSFMSSLLKFSLQWQNEFWNKNLSKEKTPIRLTS